MVDEVVLLPKLSWDKKIAYYNGFVSIFLFYRWRISYGLQYPLTKICMLMKSIHLMSLENYRWFSGRMFKGKKNLHNHFGLRYSNLIISCNFSLNLNCNLFVLSFEYTFRCNVNVRLWYVQVYVEFMDAKKISTRIHTHTQKKDGTINMHSVEWKEWHVWDRCVGLSDE